MEAFLKNGRAFVSLDRIFESGYTEWENDYYYGNGYQEDLYIRYDGLHDSHNAQPLVDYSKFARHEEESRDEDDDGPFRVWGGGLDDGEETTEDAGLAKEERKPSHDWGNWPVTENFEEQYRAGEFGGGNADYRP
ncbi:hypothetical protein ACRE_035610 [Hapsidospora chrysogenum ATCC 11550]|uniref:Uncharacterized protein n=1 Tax=Hapsidospora chrysogenum (strain ATCC 11550 / CBS 779.69 / DSM 880 / IAM 14645 / JCM 23072 / IMI 49137) TaxID=857340 RepID=A0A086T8F4_HAPC1|nr:hypothetical protein ACRE_035610 [Hapsidospora chrysogenum ATCC 11550]